MDGRISWNLKYVNDKQIFSFVGESTVRFDSVNDNLLRR